jgi:hypothetical protein
MLVDFRALLPARSAQRWGNLSKSLYLEADLADPASIESALRDARNTNRVLPATIGGVATTVLSRARPEAQPAGTPATLTFNSIPTLPGLSELPWRDPTDRRFYGFGLSPGPGSITVTAIRLRDHMELVASFDEATAPTATVHSALGALEAPADLLTARTC